MKSKLTGVLVTILLALPLCDVAIADSTNTDSIAWVNGPGTGTLGTVAEIILPEGYIFANGDDTKKLMRMMENLVTDQELGLVAPDEFDWFVVFEFDRVGYVRDDEKESLDADKMMESFRESSVESNKERRKLGWSEMTVLGWEREPIYNEATHNLEWAVRYLSDGDTIVNFNTRLLGRGGVMHLTLVGDPQTLTLIRPRFDNLLKGYAFTKGEQYAEYREGDKIAEYGLTGLIAGGAVAVAAKSGAFKWLWKLLLIGAAASLGFLKKLFRGSKDA